MRYPMRHATNSPARQCKTLSQSAPRGGTTMQTRLIFCSIALLAALPAHAASDDATSVLQRADAVMGASGLKTLRYTGYGTAASFGQAYRAGMPWPRLNIGEYTRLIDYDKGAW